MQKKPYNTPTVAYVGPDLAECSEINAPIAVAVAAAVTGTTAITTTVVSKIW